MEKRYGNIPISENEIFGKIRGLGGLGYKIKRIFNLQDLSGVGVAEVRGKTLKMNKIGKFKIDISLELAGYENAEIRDCEFEITKRPAPRFTFRVLKLQNRTITEGQILANISENTSGFSLKSISDLQDLSGTEAEIQGKTLKVKRGGRFTAKVILGNHATYEDAEILCTFEIKLIKLKITGLRNGDPKIYDGSAPTPKGTPVLSGVLAGDVVNISEIKYYTNGAGTDLPIKVNAKLGGADAGKYEVIKELSRVTQTMESIFEVLNAGTVEAPILYRNVKSKFKTPSLSGTNISALTSIAIPLVIDGVVLKEYITDTFKDNNVLESVFIANGIEKMSGGNAFRKCVNLTSVNIPPSMLFISNLDFAGCPKLVVTFEEKVHPNVLKKSRQPFGGQSLVFYAKVKKIRVPKALLELVKTYENFDEYINLLEGY